MCPLGFSFPENRLYMMRKNDIMGNESINSVKNDVKYVLKQFRIYKLSNYNYCILKAKLSKKAIKYLGENVKIKLSNQLAKMMSDEINRIAFHPGTMYTCERFLLLNLVHV